MRMERRPTPGSAAQLFGTHVGDRAHDEAGRRVERRARNRKQSRRAFGDRPLDFEILLSPEMFRRASTYVYETALRHRRWRAAETRSNRLLPQHSEERR